MTRDEIFEKMQGVLEDALGVDADEVTPEASLTDDLGAESIDFLDISFQLEREFGIEIPQGELFPDNAAQNPEYVQDGKVTEKGIEELKRKLPHVDFSSFEADPKLTKLGSVFTVDTLVRFVEQKLGAREAKA